MRTYSTTTTTKGKAVRLFVLGWGLVASCFLFDLRPASTTPEAKHTTHHVSA